MLLKTDILTVAVVVSDQSIPLVFKELTNDRANDLIDKLEYHAKTYEGPWNVEMSHNACEFVRLFSGEMQVNFFNKIMDCGNMETIMCVHKLIGSEIVKLINDSQDVAGR